MLNMDSDRLAGNKFIKLSYRMVQHGVCEIFFLNGNLSQDYIIMACTSHFIYKLQTYELGYYIFYYNPFTSKKPLK